MACNLDSQNSNPKLKPNVTRGCQKNPYSDQLKNPYHNAMVMSSSFVRLDDSQGCLGSVILIWIGLIPMSIRGGIKQRGSVGPRLQRNRPVIQCECESFWSLGRQIRKKTPFATFPTPGVLFRWLQFEKGQRCWL